MKNIEKIKILSDTKIKKALEVISETGLKIAIVVDENNKLIGTLTDGDIRRGFLKGLDINNSIKTIYSKKPVTAKISDSKENLLKIALKKKIYQIPVVDNNRNIIDIHILDDLVKIKKKNNKIIIMAGGRGMRLRPLTNDIPKPMLKVGGKPILQNIIEKFKNLGYQNMILCVNYKSQIIKEYFGDGKRYGVNIDYVHEKERMGTAGALSLLKKKPTEPFFVVNGDLLTNLDFEKMLDFHNLNKSKATMCVSEYNIESPYGEVRLNNENILSIEEKPTHKMFINAGIYILDPICIKLIPKKFFDMPSLFNSLIKKNFKTVSFPLGEYWLDIGRFSDYKKANYDYNSVFEK